MPTLSKAIQNRLHNRPPEAVPADACEELRQRLERDYGDMTKRALDLEVAMTQLPKEVNNENEGRITDFLGKQLNPYFQTVKLAHDREKRTVVDLGRVYEDFFRAMQHKLREGAALIAARMAGFRSKQREIARQIQLEQKQLAEEAFRAAQEKAMRERIAAQETAPLDRSTAREHMQAAKRAEADAADAARIINAPPDPGHVRGDYGATGYLRDNWLFQVEDITQVPWGYITADEKRVSNDIAAAVREAKRRNKEPPGISIPGIRIYNDPTYIAKG